jgi:hypothetical protein
MLLVRVSFLIRSAVFRRQQRLTLNLSYETTLKSEPQNIECRMSNVEGWIRFAQSFKIDRIPYSMFDVGRSMFDVH